jgi:hypothetical protein
VGVVPARPWHPAASQPATALGWCAWISSMTWRKPSSAASGRIQNAGRVRLTAAAAGCQPSAEASWTVSLTADYLAKVAEEKERTREERARLREEEIARREYEREQDRLRKELAHYQAAIAALRTQGDDRGAAQAEAKLTEINDAIDGLTRRAANIRAGHVYVISNVGAFGHDIVKVGMTRRLDPMDRVRELGDASVPFHYDVHAMVFSDDAVGLETHLHHQLADRKLNLVNTRREFFRARPAEVRDIITRLDASIITWVDEPEALEWRQSEQTRRQQNTLDA